MVEIPLTSRPEGAVVKEGDALLGTTPMTLTFEQDSGVHVVEVSAPNYKPSTVEVDTAEGVTIEPLDLKLSRERRRDGGKKDGGKKDGGKKDGGKDGGKDGKDTKKDPPKDKPVIPLPD